MLLNTIFSISNNSHDSLHSACEKLISGLHNCLASTKRVAEKSQSSNFQEGCNCLNAMCHEIEELDSKQSRKVFNR